MNNHPVKRARTLLLSILLLCGLAAAAPGAAQDQRLLSTKVADILARFPANGPADRDTLADEILGLGEPGLAEFTRQLVPTGSGNDTAVRFAINAVAVRASKSPEPRRALAERAFVGALGAATDVEVKTFLLSQLRPVGRDVAVKAASPLLADEKLVEPATQLMLTVRSLAARAALVSALPKSTGPAQLTIVKAVGELGAAEANAKLLPFAQDPNPMMRRAALASLARIASPASLGAMTGAAQAADYKYEPGNAVGALLEYARRLAQKGSLASAEKVCRLVMAKTDDADRLAERAAALGVLADAMGAAALPDLLKAMDHADRKYRNAALFKAEKIRGPAAVQQWVAKAKKADAERQAEIIGMLARQGNAAALPFIRASLTVKDPAVVAAAAAALGHIERRKAAPQLVALLKKAGPETAGPIAGVLGWTLDEKGLDPLVASLDGMQPAARAAAVALVGEKSGKRFASTIIPLTSDPDPGIRAAAFKALAGVVGPNDLPVLLKLLDGGADVQKAASGADTAGTGDVQKAVVAAAGQVTPEDARATPILDAMKAAAHPERFVELLSQVGGKAALAALVEQFNGQNAQLKGAAFRGLVQWRGSEAADRLFAIAASGDASYRDLAFAGFVRQISSSSLPDDQKVLQLRKAVPLATAARDRRNLLRAFERAKTFQSFLVVSSFLDDKDLANDAAGVVMRLALPNPGAKDGLTGAVVRGALKKVLEVLTGPESEYEKENVRTYLRTMPQEEGFVPIFNGKDLTGWKGLVENPIARAKMSPQDRAAKQAAADEKARTTWSVRDGTIVFNGKGDNLCTVKDYGDFEMLVDWRITKDGDSGVYLRGTPQVQIWDPARTDVGAQVGSGGLYNNQKNPSKPLVFADNPVGEWNTFRIRMTGDKVTVFLNGTKVADNVTMENYWDRTQPIFARGAIELQAHGTDLQFRDIYVREINAPPPTLTAGEKAEGFVPLFNGQNLDGWTGNLVGYKVQDGLMVFDPAEKSQGNIYTAKDYADFAFRFEFQLTPAANSGVGIRAPREGDAAYVGMEIQVLDDTAPVYATLQPYQYHGSVYGVIPAKRGSQKPVGEWNTEEIWIKGSRIKVTVNGTVIVDGDIAEASKNGTMDHKDHPGLKRASGAIGFLSHGAVVKFRNIRIRDLAR
jgi:HEAT repeat protein